jgi:hypothetical protein
LGGTLQANNAVFSLLVRTLFWQLCRRETARDFPSLAAGTNWDDIIKECHGRITRPAIAEAIWLAGRAIAEHCRRAIPLRCSFRGDAAVRHAIIAGSRKVR